jgi:hypothetical protein
MANDEKKKKIKSLNASIEKINDQLLLTKGDKLATSNLEKLKAVFEKRLEDLKTI